MEDVPRGQLGYREWAMAVIELGHCPCEDCGGHLVERTCTSCGCQHWVSEPTAHQRERYACTIPTYDSRCAAAAEIDARDRQERERDQRRGAGE